MVLSLTGETLSAQEITQRMIARGYEPRGQAPERYVQQLLRTHPQLFARQEDGRWSIASLESDGEENDTERDLQ